MFVSPTVVGEMLYIGSCSGIYYAFDRTTGEVRWTYDTEADGTAASFHGNPLVTEDVVVTGSDHLLGGHAYAFDRRTGAVRWKLDVGGLETDLVGSGPLVLGGTSDGGLIALDFESGAQAWKFAPERTQERQRSFSRTPAVDGETVFFAGPDGKVYALSAANGAVRWEQDVGGHLSTPVRLLDGHLYVGTHSGGLFRLDPETGRITAELAVEQSPHHGLVAGGECLVVLLGRREVACVDRELEGIRWRRTTEDHWSSFSPLVVDDAVIVGGADGELLAIDLEDGSTVWSRQLDGTLRGLGLARGILYVGTLAGPVHALALAQ